ncbi:site-specific integrase [Bacillus salacetis]|uniref:Site-specific integrase n=1 Tax=Bacillus salacetis TaxID=2315464 RepID=A0A3A1QU13_9BACI|nr:site-specific integrase [Bacillus salacetis]RIW28822.1 site-specific integrase [Bacillus salacetis]
MEFVEPIKDIADIHEIKKLLYQHSTRDYLFFVLGINTGMRISDLLQVRVGDIQEEGSLKEFYSPSNTENRFYLNRMVRRALADYLNNCTLQDGDYLFKSKKNNQPITRQQAYRIINKAAQEAGVKEKVGTHTLRKTFGYHAYQKGIALSILQKIFNHSTPSETLNYIGIDKHSEGPIKVDVNL